MQSSNADKVKVVGCYDHNLNTDRKRRLFNFGKGTQVPKEGIGSGLFSASNQNGDRHYDVGPLCSIGLYRENAIAIDSEARDPFGGNVYYVTMQITLPIPEFARKERNLYCDVVHVTTKWVSRLVPDHAIAAIQTSR